MAKAAKIQEQSLESIMWNCSVIFHGKISTNALAKLGRNEDVRCLLKTAAYWIARWMILWTLFPMRRRSND